MDITAEAHTVVTTEQLHEVVADLGTYGQWLGLIGDASPLESDGTNPDESVWSIALQAQLGPLRRSKLLRMVRTHDELSADHSRAQVVFERREVDGREHSPWVLTVDLAEAEGGSDLVMRLHYGGTLFVPLVERVLRSEISASRKRLQLYLSERFGLS